MALKNKKPWIEAAYVIFSDQGPNAIKVEELSRITQISKSSFYHHFADLTLFSDELMKWHLERAGKMAEKVRMCKNIDPEFLNLLLEFRQDIFFNRMLRIYRDNLAYQLCYQAAHSKIEKEVLSLWSDWLELSDNPALAKQIFTVTTDLFYQRISPQNYTFDMLHSFIQEIKQFLNEIIRRSGVSYDES